MRQRVAVSSRVASSCVTSGPGDAPVSRPASPAATGMGIGVIPYLATYCRYVSLFARARAVRGTIALTAATTGKPTMGTPGRIGTPPRRALTSFVGRRHELGRLRALLADSRLVTITGPGGAGKTRLAEEFAAGLARSFEGGSAVAYLASALAPVEVAEVAAAAV